MLIKCKTNYGHREHGVTTLKTPQDPPFEVADKKGRELVERGIAERVEGGEDSPPAPSPPKQETAESLTKAWLRTPKAEVVKAAQSRGIDHADEMTVKEIVGLLVPLLLEEQEKEPATEKAKGVTES